MTTAQLNDAQGTKGPEWALDRAKFKDIYQRVTESTIEGNKTITKTVLQRCRHYMVIRSRTLIGVTSVAPENRLKRKLFMLYTGPQTQAQVGWIGTSDRTFICTDDDLVVIDKKTGEAKHTQVWEHYSKWADVPDSEFGTTDDAEAEPESETEPESEED